MRTQTTQATCRALAIASLCLSIGGCLAFAFLAEARPVSGRLPLPLTLTSVLVPLLLAFVLYQLSLSRGAAARPRQLTRERWVAEVRRLLVDKYALQWTPTEISEYAASLAETYYDEDPTCAPDPDDAIEEDFSYAV